MKMSQLNERELRVLSAFQQGPNKELNWVARKTRMRVENVQYCLKRLRDRTDIQVRPMIDLFRLGMECVSLYGNVGIKNAATYEKFFSLLSSYPGVAWCGEFVGEYQVGVIVYIKRLGELATLINVLSEKYEGALLYSTIAVRSRYTLFGRKYLLSEKSDQTKFTIESHASIEQVDALDRKILYMMANEKYTSNREIARIVQEAPSTVDRRIRRLSEHGIIKGYFIEMSPRHLNVEVYRVLISTHAISAKKREWLRDFCIKHPRIVSHNECLGAYDHEIGVEAENISQVTMLTRELYTSLEGEARIIGTLTLAKTHRWSLFPFEVLHT